MPVLYFLKPLAQWFVLKGYLAEGIKPSPIDDHGVQVEQWSVHRYLLHSTGTKFPCRFDARQVEFSKLGHRPRPKPLIRLEGE